MDGTQTFVLDGKTLEMCLKNTSQFGQTTYNNICTGQSHVIPWGGVDWMLFWFIAIFLGGILLAGFLAYCRAFSATATNL